MISKFILCLFIFFVFFSCSNSSQNAKNQTIKYPNWFYKTKADTKSYYYGIGEGRSKQEAKINALNDIASKLSIEIKSSFTSTTNSSNKSYSSSSSKNVIAKVKNIEFSSFKIINQVKLSNNKYLVLLSIDRLANAKIKTDKILAKIKEFKQKLNLKLNVIYKLKLGYEIYQEIENELMADIFIVKSLYENKNIESYINSLLEIKQKILSFKASVSFTIIGKNKAYNDALKEEISKQGFSIKNKLQNNSKSVKIYVSVTESNFKILGNYILKSKIDIKIKANNALIKQKIIKLAGKSRTSLFQAKEFAIIEFKNKLNKDSILEKLLGLKKI